MTKTLREKGIKGLFLVSALFSMAALATITVFLLISGIPFIAHTGVAEFLLGRRWAILESPPSYGILPMIVATLYVTALSVILGTILGLFTSVCLFAFCPKKLVLPLRQLINLLAGIPSVIFGLFGMTTIVPFLRDYVSPNGVGYGILAVGRIISESAVLILTIGMVVNKMPQSILSPGTSLALDIYYFASYGYRSATKLPPPSSA